MGEESRTPMPSVARLVDGVRTALGSEPRPEELALYAELAQLALVIEATRREMSALSMGEISQRYLPEASDELEAVVGATEAAAGAILDAAEAIDAATTALDGAAAEPIRSAVTHIYEACNFQDITGQRIAKVVRALKEIETRVHGLLGATGQPAAPEPKQGELALLNGPQLPAKAPDQADIDAILAGN